MSRPDWRLHRRQRRHDRGSGEISGSPVWLDSRRWEESANFRCFSRLQDVSRVHHIIFHLSISCSCIYSMTWFYRFVCDDLFLISPRTDLHCTCCLEWSRHKLHAVFEIRLLIERRNYCIKYCKEYPVTGRIASNIIEWIFRMSSQYCFVRSQISWFLALHCDDSTVVDSREWIFLLDFRLELMLEFKFQSIWVNCLLNSSHLSLSHLVT